MCGKQVYQLCRSHDDVPRSYRAEHDQPFKDMPSFLAAAVGPLATHNLGPAALYLPYDHT